MCKLLKKVESNGSLGMHEIAKNNQKKRKSKCLAIDVYEKLIFIEMKGMV